MAIFTECFDIKGDSSFELFLWACALASCSITCKNLTVVFFISFSTSSSHVYHLVGMLLHILTFVFFFFSS